MVSPQAILWEVDAQRDFILPGGKLYVPDAEKLIPNFRRLLEPVRAGCVFLVSSADAHHLDDPELREWPAHCLENTPGAEIVSSALAPRRLVVPCRGEFALPNDLSAYQQVVLQKKTLDVFGSRHAETLLERLTPRGSPPFAADALFLVFGVVTELCVRCAVEGLLRRGRRVGIISDAVQALDAGKAQGLLKDWQARGAHTVSTEEAVRQVGAARAGFA
jgi:nicotinamidase-related amidase